MARVLKIFFHDACFDGTTSAAVFAAFYRDVVDPSARVLPVGMAHRDGDPFDGIPLDADDHACVDFRFCADPKMRWWFDHHATAFQPPALRDVFERDKQATWFFDPAAASCAGFMAKMLLTGWDWKPPPHLAEAISWADTIDAARFESAAAATSLSNPAQRLAAWLAHGRSAVDTVRYVDLMSHASLAEVAARPDIALAIRELESARTRELEAMQDLGVWHGDVVLFDRLGELGARSPGFLGYLLYPSCLYTLAGTRSSSAIRISVGVNPWAPTPRRIDIGAMCARHGGGGHAVVGGVTLRADEMSRARDTLAAMLGELTTPG